MPWIMWDEVTHGEIDEEVSDGQLQEAELFRVASPHVEYGNQGQQVTQGPNHHHYTGENKHSALPKRILNILSHPNSFNVSYSL